jgi:hypothetical protein
MKFTVCACGRKILFDDEDFEDAAERRDVAALKHFGEFGVLNFPDKREQYLKILGGI